MHDYENIRRVGYTSEDEGIACFVPICIECGKFKAEAAFEVDYKDIQHEPPAAICSNCGGNAPHFEVKRNYSWMELFRLRCFVEKQRLAIIDKLTQATSDTGRNYLANAANFLCEIMDELTDLLTDVDAPLPNSDD